MQVESQEQMHVIQWNSIKTFFKKCNKLSLLSKNIS
jgi:hypothetical protein